MSMRTWVDVQPGDWYYNEVMEASNYFLEDGDPLIQGHSYDVFESDKPRLYLEVQASRGQVEFDMGRVLNATHDNPLLVYVDGVQTLYKKIEGSTVTLYYPPRAGANVSFLMPGIPKVDSNGRPISHGGGVYPGKKLDHGDDYYWNPLDGKHLEYCYAFGRQLRRAPIPRDEWEQIGIAHTLEEVLQRYIGFQHDVYAICPPDANTRWGGWLFMPYNLNEVRCKLTYWSRETNGAIVQRGGEFTTRSSAPLYHDRFFPNASITRAETYVLISRLRNSFYQRFTDQEPPQATFEETQTAYDGQRVFKLSNRYSVGAGELQVQLLDPVRGTAAKKLRKGSDYTEFDDHTVLLTAPSPVGTVYQFKAAHVSKFRDLDPGAWYYDLIVSMELESFGDGEPLFVGRPGGVFQPEDMCTRVEAATFLHKFINWCLERFKL